MSVQTARPLSARCILAWPVVFWLLALATVGGVLPLFNIFPAQNDSGVNHAGDFVIRSTIWIALSYYFVAAILMLRLGADEWTASRSATLARTCWTLGWVTFVLHVIAALHFYHRWDHGHAVAHTREVSGVGWGIFVSYAFTALWGADVLAWWSRPAAYATRPRWLSWTLQAFMAFIIFNGTVVYEHGPIVPVGLAMFAVLGVFTLRKLWLQINELHGLSPPSDPTR